MLPHLCTWLEVEARLGRGKGIIVPAGSAEQHGPLGRKGLSAPLLRYWRGADTSLRLPP